MRLGRARTPVVLISAWLSAEQNNILCTYYTSSRSSRVHGQRRAVLVAPQSNFLYLTEQEVPKYYLRVKTLCKGIIKYSCNSAGRLIPFHHLYVLIYKRAASLCVLLNAEQAAERHSRRRHHRKWELGEIGSLFLFCRRKGS